MSDIALHWDGEAGTCDIAIIDGDLAIDNGLDTANLISLFTDARARPDDGILDGDDPRGWWGNMFSAAGDEIGCRLWLLEREKQTQTTINSAREYAQNAVQWLLDDRVVSASDISVENQPNDRLAIGLVHSRPNGPSRSRFDYVWSNI